MSLFDYLYKLILRYKVHKASRYLMERNKEAYDELSKK